MFALRPDVVLDKAIQNAKTKTAEIAGDQIYLSHPPHLTLYVAAFAACEPVLQACRNIVKHWKPPQLSVKGWHYFSSDVLTGNQTLVCDLKESSKCELRCYQSELIAALHSFRSVETSRLRYVPFFSTLNQSRQAAVESVGFPFIQDDWIPHLTIASIEQKSWDPVWEALKNKAPQGIFTCDRLSVFRLVDDFPNEFQDFPLN